MLKFMSHEAGIFGSESGKGANWHPPIGFHLLRGEAIAWLYGLALMDALYMVEEDVKTTLLSGLSKKYETKFHELQPPLGKPSSKVEKDVHGGERPMCFTNYMPHHMTNRTLSELLVGNVSSWKIDPFGITDHVNLTSMQSSWSLKYGYLDEKPLIHGNAAAGEVHFRIKIGNVKHVWICGGIQKESLKHTLVYMDLNVPLPSMQFDFVNNTWETFDHFLEKVPIPYVPTTNRQL